MKKNLLKWLPILVMAAVCIGFVSCGDDDDAIEEIVEDKTVKLSTKDVTIYSDETYPLSAVNAKFYKTSDDFVAEVDANGVIKGKHVGRAKIVAYNETSSATCNIYVNPRYNLYDTPILDWGASKSAIIKKETHTNIDLKPMEDMVSYNYSKNGKTFLLIYSFKNDKLTYIAMTAPLSLYPNLADYLLERYYPIGTSNSDGDYMIMFGDAYTKDKLKTIVCMSKTIIGGKELTYIEYMPNTLGGKNL